MNVTSLNQTNIPQTPGTINSAAKNTNELPESSTQQTAGGDSVELSDEGIALSKPAAVAQGTAGAGAAASGASASSEATIEKLQEQIAALQEEIAALAAMAKTNATAQAHNRACSVTCRQNWGKTGVKGQLGPAAGNVAQTVHIGRRKPPLGLHE